jgi:hypothetical protein
MKRLKGAIDSRIAEEQARQKAITPAPVSRSASTVRRSTSRTDSPSAKPRRPRPKEDGTTARGPDPSEFEAAFVIEDDSEEPSRVGTPAIAEDKGATMPEGNAPSESVASGEGSERGTEKATDMSPKGPADLPIEVRTKLRKLEKLESKYQGRQDMIGIGGLINTDTLRRAPKIISDCACACDLNRTVREDPEGTHTSCHNIRSRCLGGIPESVEFKGGYGDG